MNCPAPGRTRLTRSFSGHTSSAFAAISGACHAAAVDGATHLDAAGGQRNPAASQTGFRPFRVFAGQDFPEQTISGQTCSDAVRPRSGLSEVLYTSLFTHEAVTPFRRFRAGWEQMIPCARRRNQTVPRAQRAATTWACAKKVSRAFHGQQDAHRCIPPGRDPGGGATR